MNILSWDVGVCNLAYCYLRYADGKVVIHDWGKLNLCIEYHKCDESECCNQAIYVGQNTTKDATTKDATTNTTIHRCKLHRQKGERLMDSVRSSKSIDDMRYCLYRWLENRNKLLGYAPDDVRNWLNADYVAIENQPALKNPGMKSMACALYDYFLLRIRFGSEAPIAGVGAPPTIKFVSAMKKTKTVLPSSILFVPPPDAATIAEFGEMSKYKRTKIYGLWLCGCLLKKLDLDSTPIDSHTKKDDLADAFLQALTVV